MEKVNYAQLQGQVRGKPTIRESFAAFRIETVESVETPNGPREAKFTGSVSVYGDELVRIVSELRDGAAVRASGRLRNRSYEKDGATVWVTEVVADSVQPVGATNKRAPADPKDQLADWM